MSISRVFVLGTLAVLSYVLMFAAIMRFFDQINLVNGVLMVGSWLVSIGLSYLTARAEKQKHDQS